MPVDSADDREEMEAIGDGLAGRIRRDELPPDDAYWWARVVAEMAEPFLPPEDLVMQMSKTIGLAFVFGCLAATASAQPPRVSDPSRVTVVWNADGAPAFFQYRYDAEPTWTTRAAVADAGTTNQYSMPMRSPLAVATHTLELKSCDSAIPQVCSTAVAFPFAVVSATSLPTPTTIRLEIRVTVPVP